ncbi:unnamed protein product [Effrenium voratum]|nr:unnamed protein product [Effrenium voratum]
MDRCDAGCPNLHANTTPCALRGWCEAEVQWSVMRTKNYRQIFTSSSTKHGFGNLDEFTKAPVCPEEFRAKCKGSLKFTHRGKDEEQVLQLQEHVFGLKARNNTNLKFKRLPLEEVRVLARALPCHTRLSHVALHQSVLSAEATQSLLMDCAARLLADRVTNLKLKVLNLENNKIGEEGAMAIAWSSSSLQIVDLWGNPPWTAPVDLFVRAWEKNACGCCACRRLAEPSEAH